ncbi:MAG: hypothetical protein WBE92_16460, partial [Steroidobacteraceae bacterium]
MTSPAHTGLPLEASGRLATVPSVDYSTLAPASPLPPDVLAAVVFGDSCPHLADPRCIRVRLPALAGCGIAELWRAGGPVQI